MNGIRRIDLKEKTWRDERGWGINPLEAAGLPGKSLGNFHTVSITPGSVRGNHSHTGATEWLLVCGGPAKIAWRSGKEDSIHEILVGKDEPSLFIIPPLVEHAVLNASQDDIVVLSFSNDLERKTFPCPPLFNPDIP